MKILIADDEKLIRERIKRILKKHYPLYELLVAEDGKQVMELFAQYNPDILMLDIRMPYLSGLDCAEAIRKQNQRSGIIFLSGYSEFEYAQGAIKAQASEYLLKPVSEQKVIEAVKECMGKISEYVDKEEMQIQIYEYEKEYKYHECEKIFNRWIDNISKNEDVPGRLFEITKEEEWKEKEKICIWIHHTAADSCAGDEKVKKEFWRNMVNDRKTWGYFFEYYKYPSECFLLFENADRPMEDWKEEVGKWLVRLYESYGIKCVAAIGVFDFPCEAMYPALREVVELRFSCQESIFLCGDYRLERTSMLNPAREKLLMHLMKERNFFDLKQELKVVFGQEIRIRQTFVRIVRLLEKIMQEEGLPTHKLLNQENCMYQMENKLELTRYLYTLIMDSLTINLDSMQGKSIAELARGYVDRHYMEEISAKSVANLLAVHPDYFSRLFKAEAGCNFVEYLHQKRIDNACCLLRSTGASVNEIAVLTGYQNTEYFYKIFKKHVGVTPMIYRRIHRKE